MAKKVTNGNITFVYQEVYVPPQKEECHGIYELGDFNIIELDRIYIDINKEEIDIMDQLDEQTIEKIYIYLENLNF